MATRIYFTSGTANTAGYATGTKSAVLPAGTANDPEDTLRDLGFTKTATDLNEVSSLAQTGHQDSLLGRYFSPLLQVSTISAQTWQIGLAGTESNTNANAFLVLSVYVLKSDDTVRGYIYDSDTPLGVEFAGAGVGNVISFSGSAVSGVVNTDRLVVEVWAHATQAAAASYLVGFWASGQGNDVTEGSGGEGLAPWIETPQHQLFYSGSGVYYNGLFGTAQSKTDGTSLNINPADITVAAGDDIFLAYAGDDVGSAFGVTHGGTASITWTLEKENIFAGNAKAQLWRGDVTAGGTLTDITISWTTNVTAKAAVAGWFSGVGTRRNTAGGHNGVSPYHYIATTTDEAGWVEDEISSGWSIGDLVIGTGAIESTVEGTWAGVTAGATWSGGPAVVGNDGTTTGGAASNMTAVLSYGIASSAETTASAARIGADNALNRDNASAGAVYQPGEPPEPPAPPLGDKDIPILSWIGF